MKKLFTAGILIAIIILIYAMLQFTVFGDSKITYEPYGELTSEEVEDAYNLLASSLTDEGINYLAVQPSLAGVKTPPTQRPELLNDVEDEVSLHKDEKARYQVFLEQEGYYAFKLSYTLPEDSLQAGRLAVEINGEYPFNESEAVEIPLWWADSTKEFARDSFGDEVLPPQVRIVDRVSTYLNNNQHQTVQPLLFYLPQGENLIELTNKSAQTLQVLDFTLEGAQAVANYKEYYKDHVAHTPVNEYVKAISYTAKNSSFIRLTSVNDPSLRPFDATDKLLNAVDGDSWYQAGQELVYEIEVPETGNYKLALHYQNPKSDFAVFRTIRVNGQVPFAELLAYPLPAQGSNSWDLEILANKDGTPFELFLMEGKHEISFMAAQEPLSQSVQTINLLLNHISQFTLDILKITGKEIDKNRTWQLTRYIPETDAYLAAYEILLKQIISDCAPYALNGAASSTLSYLQKSLYTLENLREFPDRLPLYLEDLSTGANSIAQKLGDSISMLSEQPLGLAGLVLFNEENPEVVKPTLSKRLQAGMQAFLASFSSDKYSPRLDPEAIDIWVNRPITHVDLIQKMADAQFTPETGIKVKLSVMPDMNKLILAAAANEAPDIALGLPSYMPFDFAIRNAAFDLSSFSDFWEIASSSAPGAFVPYVLNDSVYALPETLDFNALIYRQDIFEALDLTVPDTWDQILDILPELQRYGMGFYHPIAGGISLKWFYQTSPFIYQYGGKLYNEDGLTAAIDSPEAAKGLSFLNTLFTTYSLPEQVASFYNSFRYNQIPLGIVGFGEYLQIKNAAPELLGRVALANNPGTKRPGGQIDRSFIANGTAGIILAETDKTKESWEFLKWWLSKGTQTSFAYTLQSTYGPEYVWLSGNLEALKNAPLDQSDREVILNQIEWLVDVPRTPGQYMLERSLSDIWNTAVFEGTPTGVAIDKYVIQINRENRRKMTEFGFINSTGEIIKPYLIRDTDWVRTQMEEAGLGGTKIGN